MKSIYICSQNINESAVEFLDYFYLERIRVPVAVVEVMNPMLVDCVMKDNLVLVHKKAFSLCYKDRINLVTSIYRMEVEKINDDAIYASIGSEFVGNVIDVGDGVTDLKIGDRVIPNIQYPLAVSLDLHSGIPTNQASKRMQILYDKQLIKISDKISDEVAASITILGHTVFNMIEKANLKDGDNVLVTSLRSNTSLALVSALRCQNINIWGITSSSHHLNKLTAIGINKIIVVDHQIKDFSEIEEIDSFVKETGGFDVVFDPFFDLHLAKIVSCMNINSRYVCCGFSNHVYMNESRTKMMENLSEIMINCILKNISVIGNCLGEKRHLEQAIDEYLKGNFNIPIDSVITGSDIAYFFDRTFNDPDRFGKVVYKYDD